MTFLRTSWINVLHMCNLGVSQDFKLVLYMVGNGGVKGVPLWLSW